MKTAGRGTGPASAPSAAWALSALLALFSGPAPAAAPETALFAGHDPLELSLEVDLENLCRPRESDDCGFSPSTLLYRAGSGEKRSLPVEIKVRGGWRSLTRNCSVPLLWVAFRDEDTAGTLFEGQSLLPLTTHCGRGLSVNPDMNGIRRADYEQYLLREYLAHRVYNELTEYSVRVRLARIVYLKPGKTRGVSHYTFFSEHFDSIAARTGTERRDRGSFDAGRLDPQAAARLALFQYAIGNTDWSIARERNTMLLETADARQIPVPYDLDMSGLVNAKYAGPAPGLPIDEVRERYFLGYCQPGTDWDALFAYFIERKDAVLAVGGGIPGLSRNSQRSTGKFLEGFFRTLGSEDDRREHIVQACLPWPPGEEDHTSPPGGRGGY